jgi:glycosyltransferase involved in cell wall biosynthesis
MLDHVKTLQAAGIAVVVDLDDDFSVVEADNINFKRLHPKWSPNSNYQWLAKTASIADVVTAATPAIAARYGRPGHIVTLPNQVPEWYLDVTSETNETPVIGWTGTIETHPHDLEHAKGAIPKMLEDHGAEFRVIGTGQGVGPRLQIPGHLISSTGWREIDGDYQQAIASLDLGIVPLALNQFNEGKSWLKGLEYSAMGVPFIASPTQQYLALAELGAGMTAARYSNWVGGAKLFLNQPYRDEAIERGKNIASKNTIEANAWKWAEAWELALANRRKALA